MQPSTQLPASSGASLPTGQTWNFAQIARSALRPDASLPTIAPTVGSNVHLLIDEAEVLPAMLDAVRGARRTVDLAMFSLADSGAGKHMIDSLADRARDGVQVRVTLDQVGSAVLPGFGAGREMVQRMRDAGIAVAINTRIEDGRLNPVDHRKLLVVDEQVAFTGGMNLSKNFGAWHDVMARIDGPAARVFGAHFTDRWVDLGDGVDQARVAAASVSDGGNDAPASTTQASRGVSLLANHPGRDLHASNHLLDNLAKATDRAWILTPTLSDPQVVEALVKAAGRGVDVRVAVSGPEGWIGTRALGLIGSTFHRELVNGGVKLYEQPGMSHAKVSLVDDVASVGSLNMTRRAMLWDHELMVASNEQPFVRQVENLFATDFARSTQVTADRVEHPASRLGEALRRGLGLKW